jgi:hypothetical protein
MGLIIDIDETASGERGWLDNSKDRVRRYKKKVASEVQDLYLAYQDEFDRGPLNPERRAACEFDPLLFGKTYFKEDFYLPFSEQHKVEAHKLQQAVVKKAWFANADRRGGGKSTRARMFCVWGVAYGHVIYPILITATGKSAERNRDAIIKKLMYSQELREDFPELCLPFLFCRGKGQAANHMLWKGQPAECKAAADKLVIPQTDLPYSRCTQSVLQFTSMMGEIRGNSHTLPSGGTVRPDLGVCDDPQTRLTARSRSETDSLEETVKSDIAYMNGPDKRIGMIVPCTVIYKNDLADRLLDRKLNPQFHGERTKFMIAFPTNMDWWNRYGDLRAELQMNDYEEDEIDRRCNEMYLKEKDIANAGAKVSWDYAFTDNEVSAIQHGMNRWLASPSAFQAEYQNEPTGECKNDTIILDPKVVCRRYSEFDKEVVPDWAHYVVMSIDISEKVLWWEISAFAHDMTSSTISYGTFPDQKRRYITLETIQETQQEFWTLHEKQAVGIGAATKMSLDAMVRIVTENKWKTASGREISIGAIIIDLGYEPSRQNVYDLAKRPELKTLVFPSKGLGTTPDRPHGWSPATKPKPGEKRGHHWRITPMDEGRQLQIETNAWKTIAAECFATPIGDPGAATVFRTDKVSTHEMWADQICIEVPDKRSSEKTGITMVVWDNPGHPDNHFWDCKVMSFVGASMLGASRIGHKESPKIQSKPRSKRSLRAIYESHNGGGEQ